MSEHQEDRGGPTKKDDTGEFRTGPGPGRGVGETLPDDTTSAGEAELAKEDVGFGRKEEGKDSAST